MTNTKAHSNLFSAGPRARWFATLATLAVTALLAGCGSGGSGSTIGINNQNPADNALIKSAHEKPEKTENAEKSASENAKTPASGPLSREPAVTPPAGPPPRTLEIKDLIKGTGKEVTSPTSSVTVNYVGVLFHGGKEFDSSWKRHETATFQLQGVIPGWTQGIPGMRVGGRRELVIPAALAYGAKGQGTIPPNAPLVFVIDLLGTT